MPHGVPILEEGPQQRGNDDDQTAHGGGIGLVFGQFVQGGVMKFRPVADFLAHQPADDRRADIQGDEQARQRGSDGPEDDIPVGVKVQLLSDTGIFQKMIQHTLAI